MKPFIHLFNQDLLNIYYVPRSDVGTGKEVLDRQ